MSIDTNMLADEYVTIRVPAKPHDFRERVCLYVNSGWGVWITPRNCDQHNSTVSRGDLHLQLWHPAGMVSILTPSARTNGEFELWLRGERIRFGCYRLLAEHINEVAGILVPCPKFVNHFQNWFVYSAMLGVGGRT